jgi:hypothetical protein
MPKSRKNYSGMAPITRASGTQRMVPARAGRNRRLANALQQQAHLDGDRRGTSFLDLGELVLDTPRLQLFGDRHRWNV